MKTYDTRFGDPDDGGAGSPDDPKVEALVDDIERTRWEMTETVDEIEHRLDPANIVNSAKETVRQATVGKVEEMATMASDAAADARMQARDAGEGMIETIRRNPIPAALAGIGIAWLWMSRSPQRGNGQRTSWARQARPVTNRIGELRDDVTQQVSTTADSVGRTASSAVDQAGGVVDDAREAAARVPYQVQGATREVGDTAQRLIDENPIGVGAVALAIGTAVGLALPPTSTERRVLGPTTTRLVDQAQEAVAKPLEKAEEEVRKVEQQNR